MELTSMDPDEAAAAAETLLGRVGLLKMLKNCPMGAKKAWIKLGLLPPVPCDWMDPINAQQIKTAMVNFIFCLNT